MAPPGRRQSLPPGSTPRLAPSTLQPGSASRALPTAAPGVQPTPDAVAAAASAAINHLTRAPAGSAFADVMPAIGLGPSPRRELVSAHVAFRRAAEEAHGLLQDYRASLGSITPLHNSLGKPLSEAFPRPIASRQGAAAASGGASNVAFAGCSGADASLVAIRFAIDGASLNPPVRGVFSDEILWNDADASLTPEEFGARCEYMHGVPTVTPTGTRICWQRQHGGRFQEKTTTTEKRTQTAVLSRAPPALSLPVGISASIPLTLPWPILYALPRQGIARFPFVLFLWSMHTATIRLAYSNASLGVTQRLTRYIYM